MIAYYVQECRRVLFRRYTCCILLTMLAFLLLHLPYDHLQANSYMEKERNQAYADAYLLYSSLQNTIQENTESAETFYQKEYEDYYVLMQLYESKDYEDVYKHIYTAAIPRERVLLAKLLVAMTVITAFVLITFGLLALITWLLYGQGSLAYPYLMENGTLISAESYLISSIPLYLFTLLFLIVLMFLLSCLCRKQVDTCIYFGLLMALLYICMEYQMFGKLQAWIPCFYIQGSRILSNEMGLSVTQAVLRCSYYSAALLLGFCAYFHGIDIRKES